MNTVTLSEIMVSEIMVSGIPHLANTSYKEIILIVEIGHLHFKISGSLEKTVDNH